MSRTLHPGSSPLRSRKLRAYGNGLYEVPLVSLSARLRSPNATMRSRTDPVSQVAPGAAYVDANGRWWDESYNLCSVAPHVRTINHNNEEGEAVEASHDRQLLDVFQSHPRPRPSAFSSYREYETALVRWKEMMEEALGSADVLLPTPQGRFHYRPPFSPQQRNWISSPPQSKAAPLQDPSPSMALESEPPLATTSQPPLADSNSRTNTASPQFDRVKSTSSFTSNVSTTSSSQKEKEPQHKPPPSRYPWDAILVPKEPEPEDFDTYDAFEVAMRRWAHLVSQIEVIPMHANQLPTVIPLAVPLTQQQVKTSDQIIGKQMSEPRRVGLRNVDFWDPLESGAWREEIRPYEVQPSVFLPDLEEDEPEEIAELNYDTSTGAMDTSASRATLPRYSDASCSDMWVGSPLELQSPSSARQGFSLSPAQQRLYQQQQQQQGNMIPRPSICTEDVIADFQAGITTILDRAKANHDKYPPYFNAPVLGELRGTFKKADWAGHKTNLQLRSDALRRTDLTPLQVISQQSCRPTIHGQAVEFNVPEFDLAHVNYKDLVQNSKYREQVKQQVLELQFHSRHFPCYSWYRKTPPTKNQLESEKFKAMVKQQKAKSNDLTVEQLSEVLLGPLDLDVFQDLLGEDTDLPNGETIPYGSIVARSFKVTQFPALLELFLQTQEPLAHGKISHLVCTLLQLSKAHELVQYLVGNGKIEAEQSQEKFAHLASQSTDIMSSPRLFLNTLRQKGTINGLKYLPLLCYAITYFKKIKLDLYPYSPETVDLAVRIVGTEYRSVIDLIFIHYYVKTIHCTFQAQSLEYGTAAQKVMRSRAIVASSLFGQLSAYPAFLGSMIKAIGYRSSTVSSLFTFMTLQLLHCDDNYGLAFSSPDTSKMSARQTTDGPTSTYMQQITSSTNGIKILLSDPSIGLLGGELKRLASSKFSHVRHACRRIVSALSSPEWIETSLALIESSMNQLQGPYADITNPEHGISPKYLDALGSILGGAICTAIQGIDHLTSNPLLATTMVPSPVPSARSPRPPAYITPSTSTSTLASVTTRTSYQHLITSSTVRSSAFANPALDASSASTQGDDLEASSATAATSSTATSSQSQATNSPAIPPISMLKLSQVQAPSSASLATNTNPLVTYADRVASNVNSISFLLSNRVLYSLLKICGDTMAHVDHRTVFAATLLGQLGRAYTRMRVFKLAPVSLSDPKSPSSQPSPPGSPSNSASNLNAGLGAPARRISTKLLLQTPSAAPSQAILSQMRDWKSPALSNGTSADEKAIWIGTHEIKGILQFLHSSAGAVPRSVHASRKELLVCLRQFLKGSVLFEAMKHESILHQTLSSFCRSRPYPTNTEAWRCLYQMAKFHPNTIEYLVKNKFLNLYFDGLGSYGSGEKWEGLFMTQNALKYMTKLFSLNTSTDSHASPNSSSTSLFKGSSSSLSSSGSLNSPGSSPSPSSPHSTGSNNSNQAGSNNTGPQSPSPQPPPSPSKQPSILGSSLSSSSNPDAKALSQFIISSHVFIKFHVIYKKLSELDCGAAYAELISFYYALITLPNCKKLLKATSKNDSFREGINAVTQLAPLINEMQKQDKIWSAARAVIAKEKMRAFKMREKDDGSGSSPRRFMLLKKDSKSKDKDKDKDKKKKEKEKEKDPRVIRRGKSGQLPISPRSGPVGGSHSSELVESED